MNSKNLKNWNCHKVTLYFLLLFGIMSFEFLFCNSNFVRELIYNKLDLSLYVVSPARLVLYFIFFIICYFSKDKIIENRILYEEDAKHKKSYKILSGIIIVWFALLVFLWKINILHIMTLGILLMFLDYIILLYLFYGINFKINIMLVCLISLIYSISTNTFQVLDEVSHVPTSYNIAHGNFSPNHIYFDPSLERINILSNYSSNEHLFIHYKPVKEDITNNGLYLYDTASEFLHIPAAIGIIFSEKLNGTIMDTFYIGRIFNTLFFLGLVLLLLKEIRYNKNSFIAILTTPFLLLLAGTYSMDGLGFVLISLFAVYIINIFKDKKIKQINSKHLIVILLLMFLVSLYKGASYLFVYLLLLLIINKIPKKYRIIMLIGFILTLLLTYLVVYASIDVNVGDTRGGNTSLIGQLKFLFSSPVIFIKVYFLHLTNTFLNCQFYQSMLNEMFFGRFARIFVILYIVYLIYIGIDNDTKLIKKEKLIYLLVTILLFGFTSTALYLSFTPVGETTILGYQSRYVFPFLPFILLCMKNKYITVKKTKKHQDFNYMLVILFNVGLFITSIVG